MSPYQRRLIELECQGWRLRALDLERSLANCDAAIARIRGRLSSLSRTIDLQLAERRRREVLAQLAEAQARARALALQLQGPRSYDDDLREREARGLAGLAARFAAEDRTS
jgi:hypothetical protein